jgi:hypothetical protein
MLRELKRFKKSGGVYWLARISLIVSYSSSVDYFYRNFFQNAIQVIELIDKERGSMIFSFGFRAWLRIRYVCLFCVIFVYFLAWRSELVDAMSRLLSTLESKNDKYNQISLKCPVLLSYCVIHDFMFEICRGGEGQRELKLIISHREALIKVQSTIQFNA